MRTRISCVICDDDTESMLDLPKLPLTGIYVRPGSEEEKRIDQKFMYCVSCGHGQLWNVIDPATLYNDTYDHRSSTSQISRDGNRVFAEFVQKVTEGKTFNNALDIGCNDGYLLGLLRAKNKVGIDASIESKVEDNVTLKRTFMEHYFPAVLPDLIVSSHTFEHIENPLDQLKRMVSFGSENATYFITVPLLESMITNSRWDQVFHQHLNYFSKSSLALAVETLDCHIIAKAMDYNYWGGTIMIAFKKGPGKKIKTATPSWDSIGESIATFRNWMTTTRLTIRRIRARGGSVVGFGAAQMFPTLNYHLNLDIPLDVVFDDNDNRVFKTWPGKMPNIHKTPHTLGLHSVIITALDSARPLIKRAWTLDAKRIILPTQVL